MNDLRKQDERADQAAQDQVLDNTASVTDAELDEISGGLRAQPLYGVVISDGEGF